MSKEILKVLVIDRPLSQEEKPVSLFKEYEEKGYDMIIFPFREDKQLTELIFFHYDHLSTFEILFDVSIDYDPDGGDPFYDFDLDGIDEQTVYDIIDQKFEVTTFNLTAVEK